ncbi:MAG: aminotransferase class IV [Paludibacter sp.]|nr:aminotransferase class IV [Paludibacter sp.]
MYRCIESIKLQDGQFFRLSFHQQRINQSFKSCYPGFAPFNLSELLETTNYPETGLYKYRIIFDHQTQETEFAPYKMRKIESLKLVETSAQTHDYKNEDRAEIDRAFAQRRECDDVIMVKNGMLTDTSYANIALFDGEKWYTPRIPVLYGTNRASLIAENKIIEKDLKSNDINHFSRIRIFNAMIEFGEIELNCAAIENNLY